MNDHYRTVARAIAYIRARADRQPHLAEIAQQVGLSPYHFQRLFRDWAGISPKRYLAYLTVARAKPLLKASSVMAAGYDVGLSSPSRLHEHFVTLEAMTPGEYKARGKGLDITYGVHDGPFGRLLLAQTARGVCLLAFMHGTEPGAELARLQRLYGQANLYPAPEETRITVERIFASTAAPGERFHLLVRGTNLQVQVWRALLQIPAAHTIAYCQLAALVGAPRATRAVANAVAANPVNYLIPCHRVLRADGSLGGFRGGPQCKARVLLSELAVRSDCEDDAGDPT